MVIVSARRAWSGLCFVLLLAILAAFAVQDSSAKCYAMMGMSSCVGQTDETFVGASWWFVNMHHQKALVKLVQHHIMRNSIVGSAMDASKVLSSVKDLLVDDAFWSLFDQTVFHLREFKGEPIELLYDDSISPLDLYRSYRRNSDDIIDLIVSVQQEGGYTAELNEQIPRFVEVMDAVSFVINTVPDITENNLFRMLELGALEATDEKSNVDAKAIAGVAGLINIASHLKDSGTKNH